MRTPAVAHPQIRQLAIPLLRYFKEKLPELFNDIETPSFSYEEAKLVEHPGYDTIKPEVIFRSEEEA